MTLRNNKFVIAGLLAMTLIVFVFPHNVFALPEIISIPNQQFTKENAAAWQQHKAAIQPLTTYSTGASCTHLATWSFPCSGWNGTPFANDFYYFTPYSVPPQHHTCGTTDCINTNSEFRNVTPILYSGHYFNFVSTTYITCQSPTLCTPPIYWGAPANDVIVYHSNIPAKVPIQHEFDYLYRSSGQPDLHILVTDYLQYGYN